MKLGYLTNLSEEECQTAAGIGYDCLEVFGAWDAARLGDEDYRRGEADKARAMLEEHGLAISALALYHGLPEAAADRIGALVNYMAFCRDLGVGCICCLTNSDPARSLDENLEAWAAVYREAAPAAEEAGVKIAFENWPGLRGHLPPIGTVNIAFTPEVWERMFEAVPSPALGLEFDPSHLVWQGIDWADQVTIWAERIHHVHAKDTEIFRERLGARGFFSRGWWRYRLPGYGRVDWHRFTSLLKESGYDGAVCVEHEDPVFGGDRRAEGLEKAHAFLRPLM